MAWAGALVFALPPQAPHAQVAQTPYKNSKALFDIYLDHTARLGAALYWLRSFMNPLTEAFYSLFNQDVSVIVLLHGTELVT